MANSIGYDIIVDDDNCVEWGLEIVRHGLNIETKIEQYTTSLDRIISNGITSGKVFDNLEQFNAAAKELKGIIKETSEIAKGYINEYVKEVDTADEYIF